MALYVGNAGAVKIGTNIVAEIAKWDLNFGPVLEATHSFGDTFEESTANLIKVSGSFAGKATSGDTNGQVALRTAALAGTSVALRLYIDATNYYAGSAFCQLAHGADVNNVETVSYSFTGTGAWTYN